MEVYFNYLFINEFFEFWDHQLDDPFNIRQDFLDGGR